MKKKNYSVMGLVQKAIIDSMNFSKINDSKIFIRVSPHVDSVSFHAYQGRWDASKEKVFDFFIYIHGSLSPTVKECKKALEPIYDFMNKQKHTSHEKRR